MLLEVALVASAAEVETLAIISLPGKQQRGTPSLRNGPDETVNKVTVLVTFILTM